MLSKQNRASIMKKNLSVDGNYIDELREEFLSRNLKFKRIIKTGGLFITNPLNRKSDNDGRIFTETQMKRILRSSSKNLRSRLSYYSQSEENDSIYKRDQPENVGEDEKYAIQNVGHAAQLIQLPGLNILTDPVFDGLMKVLYPAKTSSHPTIEKMPEIDVILISHNHADHLDKKALKQILQHHVKQNWELPAVLVPLGDKKVVDHCGFKSVIEVEWFTKITLQKNSKSASFVSIPADHRSGRYFMDHHKSLVCGWIINPDESDVIFKFSGDTRALSKETQMAVDAVLWYESRKKSNNDDETIPDFVCFEPSGPNYTRCDMDVTHQSASYSTLLKFIEASNISQLSNKNYIDVLKKFKTVMMHQNKFELGPDRFNEGVFVFKKLISYLNLNSDELSEEYARQKEKIDKHLDKDALIKNVYFSGIVIKTLPSQTSLFIHSKYFIIEDIFDLLKELEMYSFDEVNQYLKEYLANNTVFPKIGERFTKDEMSKAYFDSKLVQKYNKSKK